MSDQAIVLRRISTQSTTTASSSPSCVRFAELAGGTAADCAVICCCFPCGILNLAILAIYTVPAGICRRLLNKKQRQKQPKQHRLLRKGETVRRASGGCGCEADRQVHPVVMPKVKDDFVEEEEVKRLEKEMWETFYTTGFWRSPSQRYNA